jgi:hypothetical protein
MKSFEGLMRRGLLGQLRLLDLFRQLPLLGLLDQSLWKPRLLGLLDLLDL